MTRTKITVAEFTENYTKPLKIHTCFRYKKVKVVLANYYDCGDKKQLAVSDLGVFLKELEEKYNTKMQEYEKSKFRLLPQTPRVKVAKPINFPVSESFEVRFDS